MYFWKPGKKNQRLKEETISLKNALLENEAKCAQAEKQRIGAPDQIRATLQADEAARLPACTDDLLRVLETNHTDSTDPCQSAEFDLGRTLNEPEPTARVDCSDFPAFREEFAPPYRARIADPHNSRKECKLEVATATEKCASLEKLRAVQNQNLDSWKTLSIDLEAQSKFRQAEDERARQELNQQRTRIMDIICDLEACLEELHRQHLGGRTEWDNATRELNRKCVEAEEPCAELKN